MINRYFILSLFFVFSNLYVYATPVMSIGAQKKHCFSKKCKEISKKLPKNRFIPTIKGYEISDVSFKNFDQEKMFFPNNSEKIEKREAGKYWKITFQKIKNEDNSTNYDLMQEYMSLLSGIDVEIYDSVNENEKVFYYDRFRSPIWGKFSVGYNTFFLEILEKSTISNKRYIDKIEYELKRNRQVILEGIEFENKSSVLKPKSKYMLNKLASLLKKNSSLTVELQSHTNSVGSFESNMDLSIERAFIVKEALEKRGVPKDMIIAKGMGESKPIASNELISGREKNSRIVLSPVNGVENNYIITVDSFKPVNGTKKILSYEFEDEYESIEDANKTVHLEGTRVVNKYIFKQGYKVYSVSSILKNFNKQIEKLGGFIVNSDKSMIEFYFHDRGDGKQIYGKVEAQRGVYEVSVLTP